MSLDGALKEICHRMSARRPTILLTEPNLTTIYITEYLRGGGGIEITSNISS